MDEEEWNEAWRTMPFCPDAIIWTGSGEALNIDMPPSSDLYGGRVAAWDGKQWHKIKG